MTLDEVIERLQAIRRRCGMTGEEPVSVAVTNCLSSCAKVPVRGIGPGIDWDRGHILLFPDDDLERYYTPHQIREQEQRTDNLEG